MAGITDIALSLATFTSLLDASKVKEGLKNTKMVDLKNGQKRILEKQIHQKGKGL